MGKAIIHNVFSTQSNEYHSQLMRPIAKYYKMSSLLKFEPIIDRTINFFCKRLAEEFINGATCKLDEWLLFFAWDVIGEITFSKPMGFLEKGGDDSDLLVKAEKALDYFAVVGQIPALDHWLAKNPVTPIGPPNFNHEALFAAQQSIARQQGTDGKATEHLQKDMLDDFLEVKRTNPEQIDDNGVVSALLINIMAGSDTTAILLRSIVYYTLKNHRVYKKLQKELDGAKVARFSYEATQKLPYLDAVICEASRIHPGVGLLLERVVPESGLTLADGTMIPPGTIIGMNGWVIHQNKSIFGQDAESFNPDRWLRLEEETEEAFQVRLDRMKKADLGFGAGKRVCLGKNVALIETYKVIATLFLTFEACSRPHKPVFANVCLDELG
jgi:cytochrome P450